MYDLVKSLSMYGSGLTFFSSFQPGNSATSETATILWSSALVSGDVRKANTPEILSKVMYTCAKKRGLAVTMVIRAKMEATHHHPLVYSFAFAWLFLRLDIPQTIYFFISFQFLWAAWLSAMSMPFFLSLYSWNTRRPPLAFCRLEIAFPDLSLLRAHFLNLRCHVLLVNWEQSDWL